MLVSGVQPSDSVIHTRIPKRKVLVTQPCPSLCNPVDCSPPGSSVPGTLQARILEWVAIPFSGDLPDPGIELRSPALQADSSPYEPLGKPIHMLRISYIYIYVYTCPLSDSSPLSVTTRYQIPSVLQKVLVTDICPFYIQ